MVTQRIDARIHRSVQPEIPDFAEFHLGVRVQGAVPATNWSATPDGQRTSRPVWGNPGRPVPSLVYGTVTGTAPDEAPLERRSVVSSNHVVRSLAPEPVDADEATMRVLS
ncbi:hypothetical protein E1218_30065 [Kribbella turkmenica]|uniref:Uncharacterized protein n=1 Tax=Kribbella turkmenica TaxID=2530375 RepID=A0A4R4WIN4_9ACTN|nr:hypothetical protein [Kribbella turkmenica]TDD16264.1 hypothetical protein E1218_30065 [Kribbella turkmenica]